MRTRCIPNIVRVLLACAGAIALCAASSEADYTTPGTGVDWTMDDLVAHSGGAVTGAGGEYEVHATVIVAALDRLTVAPDVRVTFLDTTGTIGFTIRGILSAQGSEEDPILFDSAVATPGAWRGFVYGDTQAGSGFHLAWCDIAHAFTAIDIVGADVRVEHCWIHDALDKAIDFTEADGLVQDCRLTANRRRTIVMTLSSSPRIENCWMEDNNIENSSPYPYINIGLQGVNSPTIRGCTILGSGHCMSGGIAIWNACNGLIEANRIEGCGYGILCYSTGANPIIRGNLIVANTIHPDTINWGFGVACNGNNAPVLTGNRIHAHWYGVCAINGGRPNLGNLENGSADDDGGNFITENSLSGQIYGFYNNTPLTQTAQGNWWGGPTETDVENAIWHRADDPSLGPVDYANWLTFDSVNDERMSGSGGAGEARLLSRLRVWPDPIGHAAVIEFALARPAPITVRIADASGRGVREMFCSAHVAGAQSLHWNGADAAGRPLPSGVYFCRVTADRESIGRRFVVVR